MSLSMSRQAQIQDPSSGDGTRVCMFPDDREKFPEYKLKMEAHLVARQLLSVIVKPSLHVPHKLKLKDDEYATWLEECEDNHELAMAETAAAPNTPLGQAALHKSIHIIKHRELSKCRRASDIIISSLQSAQLRLINNTFPSNPHEIWRVICAAYEIVNTSDTVQALLQQLNERKKKSAERVSEYIAEIDNNIAQLARLGTNIDTRMSKGTK